MNDNISSRYRSLKVPKRQGESKTCVTAHFKTLGYLIRSTVHPDDHLSCEQQRLSETARTNGGGLGQASAFCSTEVEEGWEGQSRQNAEAASDVRGPGGGWHGGGKGPRMGAREAHPCSVNGRCLSSPAH